MGWPGSTAAARVAEDIESARRSGVLETPTFFINNRRYEGPWDENSLAEAMLGSLGHRLHAATVDFVRWAPSAGFSLLLMSLLALLLANSPIGPAFQSWWDKSLAFQLAERTFGLPLLHWVNDGLLTHSGLKAQVAVVNRPKDDFDRGAFLELCAMNRGYQLKAFQDFEAAFTWLNEDEPSPSSGSTRYGI